MLASFGVGSAQKTPSAAMEMEGKKKPIVLKVRDRQF